MKMDWDFCKMHLGKGHLIIFAPQFGDTALYFSFRTVDGSDIDMSKFGDTINSCYDTIKEMVDDGKVVDWIMNDKAEYHEIDNIILTHFTKNYVSFSGDDLITFNKHKDIIWNARVHFRELEAKENRFSYRLKRKLMLLKRRFSFSKSKH